MAPSLFRNGAVLNSINGGLPGWQAYAFTNTIHAGGTSGSFITSTGTTNVADNLQGNVTFNVVSTGGSGPDLTVLAQLADATAALNIAGSVTKTGNGTLLLNAGNSYTGGTTINQGTLALAYNPGDQATGTLTGNVPITVNGGGTLRFNVQDAIGWGGGLPSQINVNGGVVTTAANQSFRVTLPNVYFTGGTLSSGAGNGGDGQGNYLVGSITTNAASTTAVITAGTLSGNTYFEVASGSAPSGVDLAVSSNLQGFFGGYAGLEKEGAGKMVYTGNAVALYGGQVLVGQFQAGGTLEFSSGANVNTTGRFNVGGGNSSASGVVKVDAGAGTLTFGGDGGGSANFIGVDSGSGTMNVNGGVVNFGPFASSGSIGYLRIGSNSNATGLLNVTGGVVNIGTAASLNGFYDNNYYLATSSNATLTISGGNVNIGTSSAAATNGTIGALYLSNNGGGSGSATVNLNGGVLSLAQIVTGNSGTNTVNLNGGTLQANSSAQGADFLEPSSALNVYVGANTSSIDTQGNNITIAAPLLHGAGSPDGGVIKIGNGKLTLSNVASSFTGNVTINAGTVAAAGQSNPYNPTTSPLGNPQTAGRQIIVTSTGTLLFNAGSDSLGNASSTAQVQLVINSGGNVSSQNALTTLGPINLNGGTLTADTGVTYAGLTGAVNLNGTVTVTGGGTSTMQSVNNAGFASFDLNNVTGNTVFDVTANSTLQVPGVLADSWGIGAASLTKTDSGLMVLSGNNTYSGGTTVSGGTLQLVNPNALGSGSLTANNGTVDLNGNNLTIAGNNALPSLSGSGGIITDSSTPLATTLTVNQSSNTTFGGALQTGPNGSR